MGSLFIVEAWAELVIAFLVVILRLYASFKQPESKGMTIDGGLKQRGFRGMTMDDGLIIAAAVSESDFKQDICPCFYTC